MSRWDNFSKEERDRYVNQDVVGRHWRETLGSDIGNDFFDAMADRFCLSDTEYCDSYIPEQSPLLDIVDPVEMECLRLFYGERLTRQEIADTIEVHHVSGGNIVSTKNLTINIVQKKLESGRRAIKNAVGDDWKLFLRGKSPTIH